MKRIGILTAGEDTPALNATIHGAVVRANQLKVEIVGLSQRPPAKPEAWRRWSGPGPDSPAGDDSTSLPNLLLWIKHRAMHPALYDAKLMKPSKLGIDYLMPIGTDAIREDAAEHMRQTLFAAGNLAQPYHSINPDVHKRIRYLKPDPAAGPVAV